jgi:hypothetical protein
LYFWFDGFESGDWVIAGPGLDLRRIGRRKKTGLAGCTPDWEKKREKTEQNFSLFFSFFFQKKNKNVSHVSFITRC